MGSSPNFRGAGALLRGTSRAFSPKRGGIRRDTPSVCLTGEGSVPPPRRPLPSELGTTFFHKLKFYSIFFKKLRFPKAEPLVAHRNERNTLSCEAHFWGELPRSGKRGLFASEKAPCINTEQGLKSCRKPRQLFCWKEPGCLPAAQARQTRPRRSASPSRADFGRDHPGNRPRCKISSASFSA